MLIRLGKMTSSLAGPVGSNVNFLRYVSGVRDGAATALNEVRLDPKKVESLVGQRFPSERAFFRAVAEGISVEKALEIDPKILSETYENWFAQKSQDTNKS
ncbi:MAG: hypothetical protein CL521_01500 [Actinobacteria bacterium]|nr:hypothetical protein [Actinomycetota bacterium]|tara:strand:- start:138 stop:440 length:303 start_codon:yes stop_codon:yes gene_type:complete